SDLRPRPQCADADRKGPAAHDGPDRESGTAGLAGSGRTIVVAIAEPDGQSANGTGTAGSGTRSAGPTRPDAAADEQARRADATPAADHERDLRSRSEDAAPVRRQRWRRRIRRQHVPRR